MNTPSGLPEAIPKSKARAMAAAEWVAVFVKGELAPVEAEWEARKAELEVLGPWSNGSGVLSTC